jgi:hypothetical protein
MSIFNEVLGGDPNNGIIKVDIVLISEDIDVDNDICK